MKFSDILSSQKCQNFGLLFLFSVITPVWPFMSIPWDLLVEIEFPKCGENYY